MLSVGVGGLRPLGAAGRAAIVHKCLFLSSSWSTASRAIASQAASPLVYNCASSLNSFTENRTALRNQRRSKSTMAAPDSHAILSKCLEHNKSWSAQTTTADPTFYQTSAAGQQPKILWLGCADSRVPESLILGLPPGQIFTHRNIANIITSSDLSAQSIIEFAVGALGVEQIIVCGHTNCGGVAGALGNSPIGAIDLWLTPLREIRERLERDGKFEGLDASARNLLLVQENVRQGVRVVRQNPHVIKAGKSRTIKVHGFVYELHTGLLKELDTQEEDHHVKARVMAHDTS